MDAIGKFFGSLLGKLILVGLLAAAILFGVTQCNSARQANTKAELGEGQAEVAGENAEDAIGTVGGVAGRAGEGDDLTRSNANEIENAEGSDEPVNPAVRDAGLDSLCRRASYRDVEECVRRATAAGVEDAGSGGSPP